MDDFYAARSRLIPPLPWPTFAPPFSSTAQYLSGLRILVVDDIPDVAEILASILRMAGATVIIADDPAKALALITDPDRNWSVLVTDLDMLDYSGVDLARVAANRTPPTPVIVATALPERAAPHTNLFSSIVSKPTNAAELVELVRKSVPSNLHEF